MRLRSSFVRFLLGVTLVYAAFIAPWPGLGEAYRAWFRGLGNAAFARGSGRWYVQFEDLPQGERRSLDTRIILANREQTDAAGHTPARMLDLDIRGVGWVPVVLTIALILASPIPWRRRIGALAVGLACIHTFVLLSLGCFLLDNADAPAGPALVALSPFARMIVSGLDELLITQLGAGFVVPVAIWAATTFRRGDLALLFPAVHPKPARP
jgi:hypothetical protein